MKNLIGNYPTIEVMSADEVQVSTCPACSGPGAYLGRLGNLDWFRCVGCGIDYNEPAPEWESFDD